jgi:polyisoprenoid-binding protein YceI
MSADTGVARSLHPVRVNVVSATKLWVLDGVEFTVDATMAMTVSGRFDRFAGSYEVRAEGTRIELAVDVTSLETGSGLLDGLLRSNGRADAERSQVRFGSSDVSDLGAGRVHVVGLIEAAGRVQPVAFDGTVKDSADSLRLEAAVTLDRRMLGPGAERFAMFLPASAHVTLHFTDPDLVRRR